MRRRFSLSAKNLTGGGGDIRPPAVRGLIVFFTYVVTNNVYNSLQVQGISSPSCCYLLMTHLHLLLMLLNKTPGAAMINIDWHSLTILFRRSKTLTIVIKGINPA